MNFKVLDIEICKSENFGFTISGNIDNYLKVENLKMNGAAFEAGLRNGDCILMINGTQIQNRDDIIASLRKTVDTLNIRVIRQNTTVPDERPFIRFKNSRSIIRRSTIQESGSLHQNVIANMGSRVSMEISRKYSGTTSNGLSRNQYRSSSQSLEQMNKSNSCNSIQNIPRPMNKLMPDRKSFQINIKNSSESNNIHSSPGPMRHNNMTSVNESSSVKEKPTLNLSLRKKSNPKNTYYNQSMSNISNFSKSFQNLPFTIDIEGPPKSAFNNTSSMMSLFDDEYSNSMIADYKIDWSAIYAKVSITIINDIEKELIAYFTNCNIDLKHFPVNSMYRYITFNGVLDVVFNRILPADQEVDFHEEILKIPTEIYDIDYDMNSYNIVNLIKCNIKKIGGQVREYMERKSDLTLAKEELKGTLNEYLIKPEDSSKMHRQLDRIYKIFHELSNFLTSMVIAMSMWKFSKDFSHLYESMIYQTNVGTTSETLLEEFRRSQKNLEKSIITLFHRFKEESSEDVLGFFDKLFSETLDLSICIPLFCDKLKRDNEMLGHLENSSARESVDNYRKIQYV